MTDLYIKNLKEFKPTPAKANDAEGQVKNWAVPAAPKAPEAASNVESELSTYESAEVESASASGTTSAGKDNDGDWFELDTSPDRKTILVPLNLQRLICVRCPPLINFLYTDS